MTTCAFFDRLQRFDDAELLDRLADARLAADTGRVDQHVFAIGTLEAHLYRVSRRTRLVEDDQPVLAEQSVGKRRLADVRAPDDGDA